MSSNMFLLLTTEKGKTADGESEDDKHKKWIEVLSWSHGFSQPASAVRSSSGSTLEKANHSDLTITKYLDSATDDLLKACWSGDQFKTGKLECFRADGNNEPINYLTIDMENIIISNFSISGGGGDIPIENFSLAYSKVTYSYNAKKKEDATAEGVQKIWHDLAINKVDS